MTVGCIGVTFHDGASPSFRDTVRGALALRDAAALLLDRAARDLVPDVAHYGIRLLTSSQAILDDLEVVGQLPRLPRSFILAHEADDESMEVDCLADRARVVFDAATCTIDDLARSGRSGEASDLATELDIAAGLWVRNVLIRAVDPETCWQVLRPLNEFLIGRLASIWDTVSPIHRTNAVAGRLAAPFALQHFDPFEYLGEWACIMVFWLRENPHVFGDEDPWDFWRSCLTTSAELMFHVLGSRGRLRNYCRALCVPYGSDGEWLYRHTLVCRQLDPGPWRFL